MNVILILRIFLIFTHLARLKLSGKQGMVEKMDCLLIIVVNNY